MHLIKQYLRKRAKITYGFLNAYVFKKGKPYDDSVWWDRTFYTEGVSDRQTIAAKKSLVSSRYHYADTQALYQ